MDDWGGAIVGEISIAGPLLNDSDGARVFNVFISDGGSISIVNDNRIGRSDTGSIASNGIFVDIKIARVGNGDGSSPSVVVIFGPSIDIGDGLELASIHIDGEEAIIDGVGASIGVTGVIPNLSKNICPIYNF